MKKVILSGCGALVALAFTSTSLSAAEYYTAQYEISKSDTAKVIREGSFNFDKEKLASHSAMVLSSTQVNGGKTVGILLGSSFNVKIDNDIVRMDFTNASEDKSQNGFVSVVTVTKTVYLPVDEVMKKTVRINAGDQALDIKLSSSM